LCFFFAHVCCVYLINLLLLFIIWLMVDVMKCAVVLCVVVFCRPTTSMCSGARTCCLYASTSVPTPSSSLGCWSATARPDASSETSTNLPTSTQPTIVSVAAYTLCSEKNTHSRFLLYLRGKCFDLHKIFRVCLRRIRHSIGVKIKYVFIATADSQTFYQFYLLP